MKTKSEELFETLLDANNLKYEKIKEEDSPRPDYLVKTDDLELAFEVKELADDDNFKTGHLEVSSRTVGQHVRKKIHDARRQIQFAAKQGIPSVLLIYNNIDPWHMFGTENMDFISAMYGEYTITLNKDTRQIVDRFHGKNQLLSDVKNTSFSAVGRLAPHNGKMKITLFDNPFSKLKIKYEKLPNCFEVITIKIEST